MCPELTLKNKGQTDEEIGVISKDYGIDKITVHHAANLSS